MHGNYFLLKELQLCHHLRTDKNLWDPFVGGNLAKIWLPNNIQLGKEVEQLNYDLKKRKKEKDWEEDKHFLFEI